MVIVLNPEASMAEQIPCLCLCGEQFAVGHAPAGQRVRCPECGSINLVPGRGAQPQTDATSHQRELTIRFKSRKLLLLFVPAVLLGVVSFLVNREGWTLWIYLTFGG